MRDNNAARVVSLSPSVNLTPVGNTMVPVPYNVMDFAGHDDAYTPSVRFTGQRAMVLRSRTEHVHGDAAGTGGGVASGTVGGITEPIGHATQVRAEGSHVIRHLDRCWMNNRNTVGECQFVRDTATYPPPPDTDPIPGSAHTTLTQTMTATPVLSDAMPDPSLFRPGAQLAEVDPIRRFTGPPAPTAQPPPSTRPLPVTPNRPPAPTGTGFWGRFFFIIGMGEAGGEAGDALGRAWVGPDGVRGRELGDALTSNGPGMFSEQGLQLGEALNEGGGLGPVEGANTKLSMKAGRLLDFRTMPQDELDELMRQPWPSTEQLKRNRQALREQRAELEETARKRKRLEDELLPAPGDNARISEEKRKRRCKVGPYSEMKDYCSQFGLQAHHIVPDYTLRYGTREESMAGVNRIPNSSLPTFWSAPCICLEGNATERETEHKEAHGAEGVIKLLGQRPGTPLGTASFTDVRVAAVNSVLAVRGDCVAEIVQAMKDSFGATPSRLLLRTTWPTTDEALGPLSRGELATLH